MVRNSLAVSEWSDRPADTGQNWGSALEINGGCFICGGLVGTGDIRWTDRPLFLDPRQGGVLPGIGALAPGYVLICPMDHAPNFRVAMQRPGMAAFVDDMCRFLAERIGPFTFFEHGGSEPGEGVTSSCVYHAHIHVMPGHLPLAVPGPSVRHANLADFLGPTNSAPVDAPYLMFGYSEGHCEVSPDIGVPQFFRKQLAAMYGDSDAWDYAAAPALEQVKETIRVFLDPPPTPMTTVDQLRRIG